MALPPVTPAVPLNITHQFAGPLPRHVHVQAHIAGVYGLLVARRQITRQDKKDYTVAAGAAPGVPAIERALSGVRQTPITFGLLNELVNVPGNPPGVPVDVVILELYLELIVKELEKNENPWPPSGYVPPPGRRAPSLRQAKRVNGNLRTLPQNITLPLTFMENLFTDPPIPRSGYPPDDSNNTVHNTCKPDKATQILRSIYPQFTARGERSFRAHWENITHIFIPIGPSTDGMLVNECGLIVISPGRRLIEYFDANFNPLPVAPATAPIRAQNYGHATIEWLKFMLEEEFILEEWYYRHSQNRRAPPGDLRSTIYACIFAYNVAFGHDTSSVPVLPLAVVAAGYFPTPFVVYNNANLGRKAIRMAGDLAYGEIEHGAVGGPVAAMQTDEYLDRTAAPGSLPGAPGRWTYDATPAPPAYLRCRQWTDDSGVPPTMVPAALTHSRRNHLRRRQGFLRLPIYNVKVMLNPVIDDFKFKPKNQFDGLTPHGMKERIYDILERKRYKKQKQHMGMA